MKRRLTIMFSAAVLLMLLICLYAGALPYETQADAQGNPADFSQGWMDWGAGAALSIDGSNYASGINALTVAKQLPDPLPRDAVLFMRSNHNEISCFIEGNELFCEGVCRNRTFGITYTGIWVIIPLEESAAGKTLTLHMQKTDGNQGQMPVELLLANRNALTHELMLQSVVPITISSFMIALSIGMFIASFLIERRGKKRTNSAMLWLALFILMSGVWMLTDDNIPCLVASYSDAWHFLSFYCFMLLAVPLSRFVGECIPQSRKTMLWFSFGFMLSFLLSVLLTGLRSKPLALMLPMTHVLMIAGLGAILFYAWRDKNAQGKLRMPEMFWGLCVFAAISVGALVSFYYGAIRTYALLYRAATLIFMAALSFGTIRRALSEIERGRQFEEFTQLIPCGISRLNCLNDFSILYGNDAYYRMFGYEPEEAKAANLTRFDYMLLEEDREQIHRELVDRIKNNELNFELEARARHKSGALLYMLTTNNYLPEKGEIVSVLTNITLRKNMEEQLRIHELEFRIAAEQSDKYIMRYEIKNGTLYVHRKATKQFGVPRVCENAEQALVDLDFIGRSSLEKHRELFMRIRRGDESGSVVLQLYAREKAAFCWYHVDFTTVYDQEQQPEQAVISFYDITRQRENELAYERLRQEAASVPQDQITTFACNLTQNEIEESAGHLINHLASERHFDAYTEAYSVLTHPDDQKALHQTMDRARLMERYQNGISSHSLELRMWVDGNYRWLLISVQVVKYADNDELKAFVAIRDIDMQKSSELDLIYRSETDSLTGIMNRSAYVNAVNKLIARKDCRHHVLVMMDVDHFKTINDTLGHDMGDRVLCQVAADLRKTLREGDLLGRVGGDEFSFCLINLSESEDGALRALLSRVRSVLNHDIGGGIRQSVSIGAAAFDGSAGDFIEVYKRADLALYRAKANGRNQFVLYGPDME